MITHYNVALRLHEGNTYELLVDVETTGESLVGFDTMELAQAYIDEHQLNEYQPTQELPEAWLN